MCCPQLVIVKVWEGSFALASGHSCVSELDLPSPSSGLLCPPPSVPTGSSLSMLCFPLCSCSVCSHISASSHLCHSCRDSELCLWYFVAVIVHVPPGALCCASLAAAAQLSVTCVVTAGTSSACSELAAGQCLGLILPTSLRHGECPGGDFGAFGISTCSGATWCHCS